MEGDAAGVSRVLHATAILSCQQSLNPIQENPIQSFQVGEQHLGLDWWRPRLWWWWCGERGGGVGW